MIVKITEIGNVKYQEGQDERVWLHLVITGDNKSPMIYATIAPDASMAIALAGMYGRVWQTWALQDVMDALVHADDMDNSGVNVDTGGVRM